jgi:hypothetical protein
MNQSIQTIATIHQSTYQEAEEFCRAVLRRFIGTVPRYETVAQTVINYPAASPAEIARKLAQDIATGVLPGYKPPILQPGEPPAWFPEETGWLRYSEPPPASYGRWSGPFWFDPTTQVPEFPPPRHVNSPHNGRSKPYSTKVDTGKTRTQQKDTGQTRSSLHKGKHGNGRADVGDRTKGARQRSEERSGSLSTRTCPHGMPFYKRCYICTPNEFSP